MYFRAIEIDPSRAEAHYHIAAIARQEQMWRLAIQHARIARSLKSPTHSLFSHSEIYQWKATFEVSVAAFYTGAFDEGKAACEELLFHPDVPDFFKKLTTDNKKFYETSLSSR
jgi:hypothetical protein